MLPTSRRTVLVAAAAFVGAVVVVVAVLAWPRAVEIKNTAASGGDKTYDVGSESMKPTLQPKDKVAATTKQPLNIVRGDVVVAHVPKSTAAAFRRVVAVGPAKVSFADGRLLVDGKPLDEPYLAPGTKSEGFAFGGGCPVTKPCDVPEGSFWGMGDNRSSSKDSRFEGPIPLADVEAVVVSIVGPPERAGKVAGTNRS